MNGMVVRDATESDLGALCELRYADSPSVHRDRIGDATTGDVRYLVVEVSDQVIGFGLLALRSPPNWPKPSDEDFFPQAIDLWIAPANRGHGYGTALLRRMEEIARKIGARRLCLAVDPRGNERAMSLYLRSGYAPTTGEPYVDAWSFRDSDGTVHSGEDWALDLAKDLTRPKKLPGRES